MSGPPVRDDRGGLRRRDFLGLMGALTGSSLVGCVRKPREEIVPYGRRPEDLVPGRPRFFATAMQCGSEVAGLLVESQDGRPTKIEGNPLHPMNKGTAHAFAQAAVLGLYDGERSRQPLYRGQPVSPARAGELLAELGAAARADQGRGLALLVEHRTSPTLRALLERLLTELPRARIFAHDAAAAHNARAGAALAGLRDLQPQLALQRADAILALDADFLGLEGDVLRNTRLFLSRRRVTGGRARINRLYAVEPALTLTGAMADHRLQLPGSQIAEVLAAIVATLLRSGVNPPAGAQPLTAVLRDRPGLLAGIADPERRRELDGWIRAVARDLRAHRKRGVVLVGERQPPRAHALALLLNEMLGNVGRGRALSFAREAPGPAVEAGLDRLARALRGGELQTLVMLGGNPAYTGPADVRFAEALRGARTAVHLSEHVDETSRQVALHIPRAHFLESWGDLEASDGTLAIQQPLIAPLYGGLSELELLAQLLGDARRSGYELVRDHWRTQVAPGASADLVWSYALHDGRLARRLSKTAPAFDWSGVAAAWRATAAPPWPQARRLELAFQLDYSVYDGRYAHLPWLQEAPDPITKLSWDNAALIGPETAGALSLSSGEMVELALGGRQLVLPALVAPGVAEHCVALPLGYGRRAGADATRRAGFDVSALRTAAAPWFAAGATLRRARGRYPLAIAQRHGSQVPATELRPGLPPARPRFAERTAVRELSMQQLRADPRPFAAAGGGGAGLITPPNRRDGHQWALAIDLNACTGCGACVVACQAENNIPVVGKERVLQGRAMHWMRIDRYFGGTPRAPRVAFQPLACQQCENAPCEQVCPVSATTHSPDGLNDMAYGRCVGTRYCANNCPFKARRFNFFNFAKENDRQHAMLRLQRNPDVTVRFRGVMEKCTYCVQRIQQAKIAAKNSDSDAIPDGLVIPACAQACPAAAITFGDLNDRSSAIAQLRQSGRAYTLLPELAALPRTTYLARLRNPNPELA